MRRRALSNFDGGRGLHKQYVHMVVTSRFPELYRKENDSGDEAGSNVPADATILQHFPKLFFGGGVMYR